MSTTPTDETTSLLRARDENHARALPAPLVSVLVRHRAALALAFALACALGVTRVEWGGRADVGHVHRDRWTIASDAFPRGSRSCAFVSNDPHLRGLGASIDAHDEVIRMNNFYERAGGGADYGHKVTYVVSNTCHAYLHAHGQEGDFVREFARVNRCMLRYEPAFECGAVCDGMNLGTIEYSKSELETNFGCHYIPKAAYTDSMSALAAAQAADGPGGRHDTKLPSTGALAVFALAPSCAEVHFYGFYLPKPPYVEMKPHDMIGEHQAFRAAFPHAVWH